MEVVNPNAWWQSKKIVPKLVEIIKAHRLRMLLQSSTGIVAVLITFGRHSPNSLSCILDGDIFCWFQALQTCMIVVYIHVR